MAATLGYEHTVRVDDPTPDITAVTVAHDRLSTHYGNLDGYCTVCGTPKPCRVLIQSRHVLTTTRVLP